MARRTIAIAMIVSVLVVAFAAGATAGRRSKMPRHVERRTAYEAYHYASFSSDEGLKYNFGPVEFDVEADERWASITIVDTTGKPALAEVGQDLDRDGEIDEGREVCGASDRPLSITPGRALIVDVVPGPCGDGVTATYGSIQVDFFSPAPASPPRVQKVERKIEARYRGPFFFEDTSGTGFAIGSYRIKTTSTERFVRVKATDDSGLPAHIIVYVEDATSRHFCGATDKPVEFPPTSDVFVSLDPSPCPDGTPATATAGHLKITVSNVP